MGKPRVNVNDFIGKQYGELTIIGDAGRASDNRILVLCKCSCGKEKAIRLKDVKNGNSKSCGCNLSKALIKRNYKHGYAGRNTKERLYRIWACMRERCHNPHSKDAKDYLERGITICKDWDEDYLKFREWAYKNGYDETAEFQKCTLDRIDVNGNYEPSNCRWVDAETQANNKRDNVYLEYNGQRHTMAEWSKMLKINYGTMQTRYHQGYSVENILFCGKFARGQAIKE